MGTSSSSSGGASGLIVDCVMERGNPADSSTFLGLLDRQGEIYGRLPRQVSADGGFASRDNLSKAKERGVSDVSFSKRKGLAVLDMVKSNWVFKKLRNFRAGIEANILVLKRAFGLTRCTWSGWAGFKQEFIESNLSKSEGSMIAARYIEERVRPY